MTSYHLVHPEPVAPDCPMCADPLQLECVDPLAPARGCLVGLVLGLLAWAAIAAVVWRITR